MNIENNQSHWTDNNNKKKENWKNHKLSIGKCLSLRKNFIAYGNCWFAIITQQTQKQGNQFWQWICMKIHMKINMEMPVAREKWCAFISLRKWHHDSFSYESLIFCLEDFNSTFYVIHHIKLQSITTHMLIA